MHIHMLIHERLRWAREQAGFETGTDAAEAMAMPEATYLGHENGSRGFKGKAEQYARKFRVNYEWLMTGRGLPKKGVPGKAKAAGYIGAGAEVYPIDDHSPGEGLEEADIPAGVPLDAVLVVVRGDSMHPRYYDGEFLFYLRNEGSPREFLNRECVVHLANGRKLVKILRRGSTDSLFNLESINASTPTMTDQVVEWAAPVTARVNRQLVA